MDCPDLELLEWYATGIATGEVRLQIDLHLPGCPDCTQRLAEIRRNLALAARIARQSRPHDAPPGAQRLDAAPAGRRNARIVAILALVLVAALAASFIVPRWRQSPAGLPETPTAAKAASPLNAGLAALLDAAHVGGFAPVAEAVLHHILHAASASLDRDPHRDGPELEAKLRAALGQAYADLGDVESA